MKFVPVFGQSDHKRGRRTQWVRLPHFLALHGNLWDRHLIRPACGGPPFRGPAGPFSLKTVHWTVFRALEPPQGEGTTSSVWPAASHLPLKGKAKDSASKSLPLEGKVAERSEVG